jgi:molybdopterin synthase catalytic subunit
MNFESSDVNCRIETQPIDSSAWRRSLPLSPNAGGLTTFEGIVRRTNLGKQVTRLDYECYEPLAIKEMTRIAQEAKERFNLVYSQQIHRSGSLLVGDIAVIINVLSAHRNEAFLGCRYIIDQLKVRVPIWKREFYDDASSEWTRCHEGHSHAY